MQNIRKLFSKTSGFTLIELLVVIGILGILAAALIGTLDPLEQLAKGNDSASTQATDGIYNAAVRYAAGKGLGFPATIAAMVGNELPTTPKVPGGYGVFGYFIPAGSTAANATDIIVCGNVRSKASIAKAGVANCAVGSKTCYYTRATGQSCYHDVVCSAATVCP